eukprot:3490639-Amphidinium_carterae.1
MGAAQCAGWAPRAPTRERANTHPQRSKVQQDRNKLQSKHKLLHTAGTTRRHSQVSDRVRWARVHTLARPQKLMSN